MIEAVNSVISNAPLLRGSAEQVNSARSATPERVSNGPQAPFVSPFIAVDLNHNTAVLQIRDSDTGDVVRQFPSDSTLQARQRAASLADSVVQAQEFEDVPTSVPQVQLSTPSSDSSSSPAPATPPLTAEAQVAAQALNTGAQTGQSTTGNVNVDA